MSQSEPAPPALLENLEVTRRQLLRALRDNAEAANGGKPSPYTAAEVIELRRQVHERARKARAAGCDVSHLVGPLVGVGDFVP